MTYAHTIPELTETECVADTQLPFDYLRVSVTEHCQLNCAYCRPMGGPAARPRTPLSLPRLLECCATICAVAPIRKIRLSGGEPLLRPDLPELVAALVALPTHPEVTLTTNGVLLAQQAAPLAAAGLSRLNVSLDTADAACYLRLTGQDALAQVLRGLDAARDAGFRGTKLNAVLRSALTAEEIRRLLTVAADHEAMLRLIELMPLGLEQDYYAQNYLSADEALQRLTAALEMAPTALAPTEPAATCVTRHPRYLATLSDGRPVTVEMISPMSHPFCADCRRIRLSSGGNLIPCLLSPRRVSLLQDDGSVVPADEFRRRLLRCASLKCRATTPMTEHMWAIGG